MKEKFLERFKTYSCSQYIKVESIEDLDRAAEAAEKRIRLFVEAAINSNKNIDFIPVMLEEKILLTYLHYIKIKDAAIPSFEPMMYMGIPLKETIFNNNPYK